MKEGSDPWTGTFGGLVELPQMVSALGRKDYKNKGVWKTEVQIATVNIVCVREEAGMNG